MIEGKWTKIIRTFTPLYWPWFVDIGIALVSLGVLVYFGNLAIIDFSSFERWDTLLSLFPLLYSVSNAISKRNEDQKHRDNFERNLAPLFGDCRHIIKKHLPESVPIFSNMEKKVLDTYFEEWKKHKNIRPIEYLIIDAYLNNIADAIGIGDGDKLFLKYVLVTSSFPLHFPKLATEMEKADYYQISSPHNEFIRKLHEFTRTTTPLHDITIPDLDDATIEETINYALNTNFSVINDFLQERENRQKIDYLLGKAFENAYTNAGDLNLELEDDDSRKIILLYKYDERFSILKRVWNDGIKTHFTNLAKEHEDPKLLIEEARMTLKGFLTPYPVSKALADFPYCIERLAPNDNFSFVIYPDEFIGETVGWTPEKFMTDRVIPTAKAHQAQFNKRLVHEFPFLKRHQKTVLDANYYIFEFHRKHFSYHASQEAIPDAIKRFLIRDILDSDKAGDVVASQPVYLKQVVNNMSISGLLFTEDKTLQERIRKLEKKLLSMLKKQGLVIGNIYDLLSIGNQFDLFVETLHSLFHAVELKRKYGKKYDETNRIATTIVKNAEEILGIFTSFQVTKEAK